MHGWKRIQIVAMSNKVSRIWIKEKTFEKVNDIIIGRSIILSLNGNYFWLWLKPDNFPYIDKRANQVTLRLKFKSYNLKQMETFWIDTIAFDRSSTSNEITLVHINL